jgi:hypothetical protein
MVAKKTLANLIALSGLCSAAAFSTGYTAIAVLMPGLIAITAVMLAAARHTRAESPAVTGIVVGHYLQPAHYETYGSRNWTRWRPACYVLELIDPEGKTVKVFSRKRSAFTAYSIGSTYPSPTFTSVSKEALRSSM